MAERRNNAEAVMRRRQACELHLAGVSYEDIASQLGFQTASGAYQAVRSGVERQESETARQIRDIELRRLDAMLVGLWPTARKGNVAAVDRVLRIMERRAHYLGLDELHVEPTATTTAKGSTVDDLRARRAARRATTEAG
jgi:hypothetical protein